MGLNAEKTERKKEKPKKWRYSLLRDVEKGRRKRNLDPKGTKKSGTNSSTGIHKSKSMRSFY